MGAPANCARSWHLTILAACISPSDPPMVLKSCAKAKTVRPFTIPYPVTTPSPGTSVWSMPKFTQRCSTNLSSSTKVPSSKRRASLSRADSLPVAFTFSRALAPPPSSIFFSRVLMSSIFSLFVTAPHLFLFWIGLCGVTSSRSVRAVCRPWSGGARRRSSRRRHRIGVSRR